jgi:ribosomal-protein-alanine N-acetyltransferase
MERTWALSLNPALTTERLALEPLEEAHAELLYEPLQDEALYAWISVEPPPTMERLRASWRALAETRLSPDGTEAWLGWAARRLSDGRYIGKLDVSINEARVAYNVGYLFFPAFWGHGHATEAVRAVTRCMVELGVAPLVATVTRGNHASSRVLEKCGYRLTRVLPGNDVIRGVPHDDLEYVYATAGPR